MKTYVAKSNLISIDILDQTFQCWHPTGSQMAILEEHPFATLHGAVHQRFGARSLALAQGDGIQFLGKTHLPRELVQSRSGIRARRQDKNEGRGRGRVLKHLSEIGRLWLDESLTEMTGHKVLHGVGYFVGTYAAKHHQLLETVQTVCPLTWLRFSKVNKKPFSMQHSD